MFTILIVDEMVRESSTSQHSPSVENPSNTNIPKHLKRAEKYDRVLDTFIPIRSRSSSSIHIKSVVFFPWANVSVILRSPREGDGSCATLSGYQEPARVSSHPRTGGGGTKRRKECVYIRVRGERETLLSRLDVESHYSQSPHPVIRIKCRRVETQIFGIRCSGLASRIAKILPLFNKIIRVIFTFFTRGENWKYLSLVSFRSRVVFIQRQENRRDECWSNYADISLVYRECKP